jgi:Xaa-Pro aminopeptidase
MWPAPSPASAFAARRQRLLERHPEPALLAAGAARARNFPHNRYPFRAESHFLYLVGLPLEGAALLLADGRATLFAPPPEPGTELWSGPALTLDDIARSRGLEVRAVDDLEAALPPDTATLPTQDAETSFWLGALLERDVEPGGGDELVERDARLADAMIELRLRHDEAAVDQLRQAAAVTERAHRAGMAATRAGLREAHVRARMEARIVEHGMSCSYNPIVTTHGEVLHNERHDHELVNGDLLLADVGAETPEGWAGDVTRTWPVSGRFSASQRAIYEAVRAAQQAAIDGVRPGVRYRELHRVAGRVLVEALVALGVYRGDPAELYEEGAAALFFPHGVGHLLGLDVHDMEDLGDRAGYAPGRSRSDRPGDRFLRLDRDLEPGMCVTIEPGFYRIPALLGDPSSIGPACKALDRAALERFADVRGIRIEDDVLVTERGCEVLTAAIPKAPREVEAAMAA